VTRLVPRGEVLQVPLPSGMVYIHVWEEGHYGPNPFYEGCIRISSIVYLIKWEELAMIKQLVGLVAPHQV